MRSKTAAMIGVPLALLLTATPSASVNAGGTWKSLRTDDGHRIRWHSCTVTYAVDLNGYSPTRKKALNAAIRSTEDASGVDFVKVPWRDADLKISLSHRNRGDILATTQPWLSGDEYTDATVKVYRAAFGYPYADQVDNYRHEFGHVLGLNHVHGSDIMNATVVAHPTRSGWRSGLKWLYRGCR